MDFNSQAFKAFLSESRQKAEKQLSSVNVGQEFKDVLSDLLQIVDATEEILRSGQGQSADVRVLKGRFDQTKSELYQMKKDIESLRKSFMDILSDEVVNISQQIQVLKKNAPENAAIQASAKSIQHSVKNLVNQAAEVTKEISKSS